MRCSYLVHCQFDNIAQGAMRLIDCCIFSNGDGTEEGASLFARPTLAFAAVSVANCFTVYQVLGFRSFPRVFGVAETKETF